MRGRTEHMSEYAGGAVGVESHGPRPAAASARQGQRGRGAWVAAAPGAGPVRTATRTPAGRALLAVAGLFLCASAVAGSHVGERPPARPIRSVLPPAGAPLEAEARRTLLETYAPTVLLAPGERALPASVEWYLARSRLVAADGGTIVTAAFRSGGAAAEPARLRPTLAARAGSRSRGDWTAYGHVYRAADGGILLQYWFFYAFNDFHGFGDHDADWEHVTVRLSAAGRPLGAWYARHDENAPGAWFEWDALAREDAHPVVLSARGSHASYARPGDVAWFDDACPTFRTDRAAARGCQVWRTWDGSAAGVRDLGSRAAPAAHFVLWGGLWGAEGGLGDEEGGPPGPAFQPGWCSGGAADCT